ncbi:MAG: DegV family protein [Ruminiclostridium sp.]|nr:DegV family protein [Ruminiclostridium sp.]
MREYVIVTDSCCDLPQHIVADLGLTVIPLSVQLGSERFYNRPGEGPDTHTFYDRLFKGEDAKTSAPNVGEFKDYFRPILQEGKDILYIAFTSALSATYQNSTIAIEDLQEEFPEAKILAVDSLCASLGQGLLVDLAVQEQRKGKTLEEVRDFVEGTKNTIHHWVTVGNLTQLKRGGRLTAAKAFFGSLLHVKPIIHVDSKGRLVAVDTIKGRKKAINHLVEQMEEMIVAPEGQRCYIVNSDCTPEAEALAEVLKEKFPISEVVIGDIGPVIGSHTGKDTIAVFFQGQERTSED